jgi:ubiquinone biosynthesis protein
VDVGDIGHIFVDLVYVFGQNGVRLSRDYTLLARAVVTIEHTGRQLDPAFDIGAIARPFLDELAWERWRPAAVVRQVAWALQNGLLKLNDLPADLQRLLAASRARTWASTCTTAAWNPSATTCSAAPTACPSPSSWAPRSSVSSIVITTGIHPLLWGYPAIGSSASSSAASWGCGSSSTSSATAGISDET